MQLELGQKIRELRHRDGRTQEALAEITGDRVSDKLLDSIFSQFCVGK